MNRLCLSQICTRTSTQLSPLVLPIFGDGSHTASQRGCYLELLKQYPDPFTRTPKVLSGSGAIKLNTQMGVRTQTNLLQTQIPTDHFQVILYSLQSWLRSHQQMPYVSRLTGSRTSKHLDISSHISQLYFFPTGCMCRTLFPEHYTPSWLTNRFRQRQRLPLWRVFARDGKRSRQRSQGYTFSI